MELLIKELKELKSKSMPVVRWYAHPYEGQVRGPWNRWFQVLNPETERQVGTPGETTVPPGSADVEYCAAAMNAVPELIDGFQALVGDIKTAINMLMEYQEKHDPDFNNEEINRIKYHLMGSITDSETGNAMSDK